MQWILRRGSEDEYMGEISAECTDGADLPSGEHAASLAFEFL